MKTKLKIMTLVTAFTLAFSATQGFAGEENAFKAIGKVTESPAAHTTKHEHELKFVRLSDGEVFDIVDSPALLKAHCETEKNSVVEIQGYRTGKFLFWGGDLVVTAFKVHEDIEVPRVAHVTPESIVRPASERRRNPKI